MRKLIFAVALVFAATFSAKSQVRVEALGNFSSLDFDSGYLEASTTAGFGYGVRALYNLIQQNDAGLAVGLGFMSTKSSNDSNKGTITLNNLQLPIHAYYGWDLGKFSLSCNVGFYAAYAISGNTSLDMDIAKLNNNPFEGEGGMKRFDFGSDDEILFNLGHVTLGIGLQYGFLNLCKYKDIKIQADNVYFAVGYAF